jgi:hypothetical protein
MSNKQNKSKMKATYTKVNTRFMDANKDNDGFIANLLADEHGMGVVCNHEFDYFDALFSNGFVRAISDGKMPIIGTEAPNHLPKRNTEYHHVIFGEECYVVYFTGDND